MVIGEVRFSFVQLWEPRAMTEGQPLKYSTQCLIDKNDTKVIQQVEKAIQDAIKVGIAKGILNKAQTESKNFKNPLRDGDQYHAESPGAAREACKGNMFFNASANVERQPAIVDSRAKPIMNRDEFYSGCYGYVDVNFYAYNKSGGMGIAVGLNSVLKKRDGERLDGRQSAESAFADIVDKEGSEGELV